MFDWIPFAVGAVVLLWALASFAMAASGGSGAGMHQIAPGRERAEAARRVRRQRKFQLYQVLNYGLALGVVGATVALFGYVLLR